MSRLVLAGLSLTVSEAGPLAERWVRFVSLESQARSVWSNAEQLAREAKQPDLPKNQTHPFALQTRFPMNDHIAQRSADEHFVAIEMGGDTPDCLPDCGVVLFGLADKDEENVLLKSYKSDKLNAAVKLLQDNPQRQGPVIDMQDLEFHGYSITYRWFPGNLSFFGSGGGKLDDGSELAVFETIASHLVAPLELFYGPDGKCETEFVTPLEYHPINASSADGAVLV
jgi:hypothetical protein